MNESSINYLNTLPLRSPDMVMKPERLGALHQTRLSFVRTVIRKMMRENWHIERTLFDLDAQGYGSCIYTIKPPGEHYSLVIFSQPLADDERTDRVIAEKWDLTCTLCEGPISETRLAELLANVPKQEAGRNKTDALVLARANKSMRNFDHVVDCLARGEQPNPETLARVGYLYRTTAVYGNGKFGIADYAKVRLRDAFPTTFSAQLFAVYLLRRFSIEQAEHIAHHKAPATAVTLNDDLSRYLGVGNATGLGMVPFLVTHPKLFHAWVATREIALARVLNAQTITPTHMEKLLALIDKAITHIGQAYTEFKRQTETNATICREMMLFKERISHHLAIAADNQLPANLWQELATWAFDHTILETQELINSLLLELYPELVNELENYTGSAGVYDLQPEMSLEALKQLIEGQYGWALQIDFDAPGAQHYFWYRSLEKTEPRLGEREHEPGAEKEMGLVIGRSVKQLYEHLQTLSTAELTQSVVRLLLKYPDYKGIVRRIQSLQYDDYAEIRDNIIDQSCLPIHTLRCKLAFMGASKFDPKSNLWVRVTFFQGAPLVSDIGQPFADDWCFPCMPDRQEVTQ